MKNPVDAVQDLAVLPFTRAAAQAHRAALESKGYAPSTINQRLAAIKKLAREAAANFLFD